jgi:hypothetical protein
MTDHPPTLTRREALSILDPDGTGLIQVHARPVEAATWRSEVTLAHIEPSQAPGRRRNITWHEVARAEAPTAGEALALAVASYQKGRVVRFDREELIRVYDTAYLRSKEKPLAEREADAAEALACHAAAKALGEIARLGADIDRLRFALQTLADAADVALFEDATWAGAPVPPALLEGLHQAESAARTALTGVEPGHRAAAGG